MSLGVALHDDADGHAHAEGHPRQVVGAKAGDELRPGDRLDDVVARHRQERVQEHQQRGGGFAVAQLHDRAQQPRRGGRSAMKVSGSYLDMAAGVTCNLWACDQPDRTRAGSDRRRAAARLPDLCLPVPDHGVERGQQGGARRAVPGSLSRDRSARTSTSRSRCWSAPPRACISGSAIAPTCATCRSAACCFSRLNALLFWSWSVAASHRIRRAVRGHLPVGRRLLGARAVAGVDARQPGDDHARGQALVRLHRQRRHSGLDRRRLRDARRRVALRHREHAGVCRRWRCSPARAS